MGRCLLLACGRIQDSDKARNPTLFENTLDGHVILLLTDKRKDSPFRILSLIAVKNFQSSLVQRHTDYLSPRIDGFARYILNGSVDYIFRCHTIKIGDAAAYESLEDEDVTLKGIRRRLGKVMVGDDITFIKSDVVRRTIVLRHDTMVFLKGRRCYDPICDKFFEE